MVPPAWRAIAQLRARRRLDRGVARRRPQAQAAALRPHGRYALRPLPALLRAQALRGRRQAGQTTATWSMLRRAERPLPLRGGAARRRSPTSPIAPVRWLMRVRGVPARRPRQAGARLARPQGACELVLTPGEFRDRLTRCIYVSNDPNDPTGLLEVTLVKVVAAEAAEKKLDRAVRAGTGAPRARQRLDRRCGQARRHHRERGAAAARGRAADRHASSRSTISIRPR